MKFYGDFLVEKGLINNEQLLEAMVAQCSSSPAVPELVYKEKLLSSEQQLSVLRTQQEKGCSYREAMHLNGVLTEDINAKLHDAVGLNSKHFVQFILENGYSEPSALNAALDEYVADYSNQIGQGSTDFTPPTSSSLKAVGSDASSVQATTSDSAKENVPSKGPNSPEDKAIASNESDSNNYVSLAQELLSGVSRERIQSMLTNTLLEFQSVGDDSLLARISELKVESVKVRALFEVYQCDEIIKILDKVDKLAGKPDVKEQSGFEKLSGAFLLIYDIYDRYLDGKPYKVWQKISETDEFKAEVVRSI